MIHENSLAASVPFPYDEVDEEPADPGPTHTHAETLEALLRLVSYVRSQDRARLTLDCLLLALGAVEAETMSTIAAKHGITKAAVSKRVKKIRRELHLPPNANNKSSHATRRYRLTNASPLRIRDSDSPDARSGSRAGRPARAVAPAQPKV